MSNYSWYNTLNLKELSAQFGSPLWIVNAEKLKENIGLVAEFTGHTKRILYPVKCNPAPIIMETISAMGCGADCSSLSEINLALLAGISWEKIAYNSPYQDLQIAQMVLENGGVLVCDDLNLLAELSTPNTKMKGQIWLRINPLRRDGYLNADENNQLMSHGQDSSKFGIPEEDIPAFLESTSLNISGLHLHVGTQMDNLNAFSIAIDALHDVAEIAQKLGHQIKHLDVGGGLGIAFNDKDEFPSLSSWVKALKDLKKSQYTYYAEPGHALVGNSVGLLTTVKTIKQSRGRNWAICDVGTDQLAKITLLHWPHKVFTAQGTYLPFEGKDALAGPLCFAGDNLLENTNLEGVKLNDPLLVTHAGAYTHSLSNSFNGRTAPAWILAGVTPQKVTDFELSFNRLQLQHHKWADVEMHDPEEIEADVFNALLSPYLKSDIQNDNYEILEIRRNGSNRYTAKVEIKSEVEFVSMPTAARVIGNLCVFAVLHKNGFKTKQRPVIGKKMQMEYLGKFKTGINEIDLQLSEEVNKNSTYQTVHVSYNNREESCRGSFLIKF